MSTRVWFMLAAGCLFWATAGCISVKAPEQIEIGGRSRPEPVNSSRVPATASREEGRRELRKAYQNIQWLERDNQRWREKAAEYKRERDEYKQQRDRCKDRLEEYEDE